MKDRKRKKDNRMRSRKTCKNMNRKKKRRMKEEKQKKMENKYSIHI
jgi:hypothetical protein